jgi:membrane associated rhomboid family serine protease
MGEHEFRTWSEGEEDEFGRAEWPVAWHAHVPAILLAAAMTAAWLIAVPSGGMMSWCLSGVALARGHFEGIALHMVAHGGLVHIVMNAIVLVAISGAIVARLGDPPASWARYAAVFVLSALAGAGLYLLIHPHGEVPMLGASGAIYGLVGLLLRLPPEGEALMPLRSARMRRAAVQLVKENLLLIVMLTLPALLSGKGGGLAWEAHLGGILFGLFAGARFLPRQPAPSIGSESAV